MKSIGIVRKVDELGRIVLPMELRRTLDINARDPVEIFVDDVGSIVLRKFQPSCIFCNEASEVQDIMGKNVCKSCLRKLKDI